MLLTSVVFSFPQVFDLDNAFFGSDLLDFNDDFCQAPSSPSDGVLTQPFASLQLLRITAFDAPVLYTAPLRASAQIFCFCMSHPFVCCVSDLLVTWVRLSASCEGIEWVRASG